MDKKNTWKMHCFMALLAISIVLAAIHFIKNSQPKVVDVKTEIIDAIIVDTRHSPESSDAYHVLVKPIDRCDIYDLNEKAVYEEFHDMNGEHVIGSLETKTYDDGYTQVRITSISKRKQ